MNPTLMGLLRMQAQSGGTGQQKMWPDTLPSSQDAQARYDQTNREIMQNRGLNNINDFGGDASSLGYLDPQRFPGAVSGWVYQDSDERLRAQLHRDVEAQIGPPGEQDRIQELARKLREVDDWRDRRLAEIQNGGVSSPSKSRFLEPPPPPPPKQR